MKSWTLRLAGMIAISVAIIYLHAILQSTFVDVDHWSGWILFFILIVLVLQRLRRLRLLWGSRMFFNLHLGFGLTAIIIFVLHSNTGTFPQGSFDRLLWITATLVLFSGLMGWVMQKVAGQRNVDMDLLPYAKIIARRGELYEEAKRLFESMLEHECSYQFAHIFTHQVLSFIRLPKNIFGHILGRTQSTRTLLSAFEQAGIEFHENEHFIRMKHIIVEKDNLDKREAIYWLQQGWLWVHIPAAAALICLVAFHIVFVHVYGG